MNLAQKEAELRAEGLHVPDEAYLVDYDLTTGQETWRYQTEFIVVQGRLDLPDDDHDCDDMGCSSVSHVIERRDAREVAS